MTHLQKRHLKGKIFQGLCTIAAFFGVLLLIILLADVAWKGLPALSFKFIQSFPSRFPAEAGIKAALWGTIWLMGFTAAISIPIGIAAGIYLEDFAKQTWLNRFIQLNISNLAGVPSIVYGLLGLAIFVRTFGLERSVISGALTMSLLVLPTIIISTQEALRAVPQSIRFGAMALGGTRWQAVRDHVLPASLPGILTGVILAMARAMGETAPLIMIGALSYVAFVPEGPMDAFTALPIQIFNWASRPQKGFHELAAAGILVLLMVLLSMNAVAIWFRLKFQKRQKW